MNVSSADKCLIFAHRGANKEAAENTRAAFDKALQYPIDGIETDVQLSRDNVSVLYHDRFLDHLGLPGKRIDDFEYSELEKMNFAGHFSAAMKPEGVLSLEEFVASYRGRCKLQIEIKNRDWEPNFRHEIKIKQCLAILGPENHDVFISSFNLQSMILGHQHAKNFPFFYAFREFHMLDDVQNLLEEHAFLAGLCLPIEMLTDQMMALVRTYNKEIVTYTCNSTAEIGKALDLGVDILISDYPQKALQMRV